MPDILGTTLQGRYHIDAFLGRGGMADVYRMWDTQRAVHLAMKVLHEDLAEDLVFVRRFQREAQTLARLQHPHIVRFYGLEEDQGLAYILMDYVDGTTLRKEISRLRQSSPLEQARQVLRAVCSALHYAHQAGVVHCDMKPANIMLHRSGLVQVTDFGIARMTEAATTTTLVGAGTPAYMAPEQVRGAAPSPQTDIYALGIVLYEMFTGGARPFTGESAQTEGGTAEKVRWEQVHQPPPSPRRYNPDLPGELEGVILTCLEKDPQRRYPRALDLFNAFESACAGDGKTVSAITLAGAEAAVASPERPAQAAACPSPDAPPFQNQPSTPPGPPVHGPAPSGAIPARRRKTVLWLGLAMLVVIMMVGMSALGLGGGLMLAAARSTPTPASTWTSLPSYNDSPTRSSPSAALMADTATLPSSLEDTATHTAFGSADGAPTHTPTIAESPVCRGTLNQNAPIRSGPGFAYPAIDTLNEGMAVTILGRNNDASWLYIDYDLPRGGWISQTVVDGDLGACDLPYISAPPPPTQPPTERPPKPKPTKRRYP